MGTMNSFKCPRCGEYTRHISISMREVMAISIEEEKPKNAFEKGMAAFLKLDGAALDIAGVGSLNKHVIGISPYKCCKCGRCSWRKSNGEEKDYIGYSK